MHLGLKQLADFYQAHRADEYLVLATVVATEGSTYRKAGAMMLFDGQGGFAGLISGGCLEDDLAQHAHEVFADGQARRISYDLHDNEELVLGLGLGCGGDIHLLLQRLDRAHGFGFLSAMFRAIRRGLPCTLALVTAPEDEPGLGAAALLDGAGSLAGDARLGEWLLTQAAPNSGAERCREALLRTAAGDRPVLLIAIDPPPRVLICGAGPDAAPLAAQVLALGWRCIVMDHRPAYANPGRFPAGVEVHCQRPLALREHVEIGQLSAAVVMSHHLEHDATYLDQLADEPPAYLGLLGPAARRRQLAEQLGQRAPRIHGPAGLDIGAELPESIALSIMAEIHAALNDREGGRLSEHGHA